MEGCVECGVWTPSSSSASASSSPPPPVTKRTAPIRQCAGRRLFLFPFRLAPSLASRFANSRFSAQRSRPGQRAESRDLFPVSGFCLCLPTSYLPSVTITIFSSLRRLLSLSSPPISVFRLYDHTNNFTSDKSLLSPLLNLCNIRTSALPLPFSALSTSNLSLGSSLPTPYLPVPSGLEYELKFFFLFGFSPLPLSK